MMTRHLLLLVIAAFSLLNCTQTASSEPPKQILSFEECVAAGNPVMRSHPPKCRTKDGIIFEQGRGALETHAMCVDRCGDGECQELVCLGSGCPCGESSESCPEDCGGGPDAR